ncbi:gas vesicle protein [Streptomyces sp. NPDC048639]|uniref:gas vesicle protein n=1 Tax=Streptomyces sp. NPDC048639 TaxID=3365581 RepID=UPI00371FB641
MSADLTFPAGSGIEAGSGFERDPAGPQVALIDLLDRLLNGGAVLTGDLVLSVADVDLVHINLRAVIRSVTEDGPAPW